MNYRLLVISYALFLLVILLLNIGNVDCKRRKSDVQTESSETSNSRSDATDPAAEETLRYKNDKDLKRQVEQLKASRATQASLIDDDLSLEEMEKLRAEEKTLRRSMMKSAIDNGETSNAKANILHKLGRNLFLQKRFDEAFRVSKEIVRIHESLDGVNSLNTMKALGNMGAVAFRTKNHKACEYAMQRAMFILVKEYGLESKEVLLHRGKMMTFQIPGAENSVGIDNDDTDLLGEL